MKVRNSLLTLAGGMALLFASCKKDAVQPTDDALTSSPISNEANAADALVETETPLWTSVVTNVNSNCAGFWQGVPALYSQTTKKYPLIVFIHGIGELGTNISRINCCGLPSHMSNKTFPPVFKLGNENYSFLVIAPQFKVRPSAADVQSVVDYARSRWRVDDTRIYITGLSMGGGSTWDYAAVYGEKAAAIVPVCGGTAPSTSLAQKLASKNLAIWGLYSTKDEAVPVKWGQDFFTWIDQYNATYAPYTKLTIWDDVDHNNTWKRAFNPTTRIDGYNIYEWMLIWKRGSKGSEPANGSTQPAPTPTSPANKLPIANAGEDQTVPADWNWFPNLNANFSTDPDGWIAKFKWEQVSGPNQVTIVNPNTGNTKVTGWTVGTYVFRVTVTDNFNGSSTDEVKITITGKGPVNNPPTARAGDDQTVPASWNWFPNLNANFSTDSDGWIAKFQWTQVSGPNQVTIVNPNTGNTKVTGWTVGTYTFRVAVTDNQGATSYDEVRITIQADGTTPPPPSNSIPAPYNPDPSNKPPVAEAGADQSVPKSWNWFPNLNANFSKDPDGWIAKFTWQQISGPTTVTFGNPNTGNTPISGLIVGTYVFRVAVQDNKGAISYDDVKITITNN